MNAREGPVTGQSGRPITKSQKVQEQILDFKNDCRGGMQDQFTPLRSKKTCIGQEESEKFLLSSLNEALTPRVI